MAIKSIVLALIFGAMQLGTICPAVAKDTAGAHDYPGMSRFEGSSLIGSEALPFEAFSLPTGPVKQDEAFQWQLTDKIDVEGKINGYVYAIPKGHSTLEVFQNYEAALQNLGFEKLFSCDSEATCGAPDTLAQRIYDGSHVMQDGGLRSAQAIIYGSEIHYLAAKRSRDGADSYASLLVARESSMSGADQDTLSAVLHIIEPKPIGQSMVMVDAAKMDSDIGASGHVSLYGIHFDTDSAAIRPDSEPTLAEIAKLLKAQDALRVYIVGHTDDVGGYDYNMKLSAHRAKAVMDTLTSRFGIPAARLHAAGVGFLAPVAPNTSEDGRAKNRRVELVQE